MLHGEPSNDRQHCEGLPTQFMTAWPTPNGTANGSATAPGNGSANGNGHLANGHGAVAVTSRRRRKRGIRKAKPGCRRPLMVYDRVKVSVLLLGIFAFLSFLKMADNPLVSFVDAVRMTFNS
ncbi:MAG: hypothetical protein EBV42_07675, partial [Actinobacteria bacterium]|nr:hypothetical protein [Actinomycetota bacterium]